MDRALALAGLQKGEHLLDLGCGDGRVLVRAATVHGAVVTGVELDPALAASARDLLRAHGVEGMIVETDFDAGDFDTGDLDTGDLDADVVFAYLSPATLQRLRARLGAGRAGTRLVTTGYPVPGWEADEADDRCHLYRLPATETPVDRAARGWASAGVLVSVRPDAPSLVAVKLHHRGGPVAVSVSGETLSPWLAVRAGADTAAPGDEVIVDLRFDPRPAGTLAAGTLDVSGEAPLAVFAAVDDGDPGLWGLSASGCDVISRALAAGNAPAVLAQARGEQ
ncbi:MAG: class I SAM-dependent methyltransferase [Acidimicrobiia bacterium]